MVVVIRPLREADNYFTDIGTDSVTGVLFVPQHEHSVPGKCRRPPDILQTASPAPPIRLFAPSARSVAGYCMKGNVSIKV